MQLSDAERIEMSGLSNTLSTDVSGDGATVDGLETFFEVTADIVIPDTGDTPTHDTTCDGVTLWTLQDAAEHLATSTRTILRKLKNGSLKGRKVIGANGPEWRIDPIAPPVTTATSVKTPVKPVGGDNASTDDTTPDKTVQVLLRVIESQAEQLKVASEIMLYQRQQLADKESELKLLTMNKASWWQSFCHWFIGKQ